MEWWHWLLIGIGAVLLIAVGIPLKLKLLKKMMNKKEEEISEE